MTDLTTFLENFSAISLEEMDRVVLQNRVDTKYVFEYNLLPTILNDISPYYAVLEIENRRINSYKTLYYDTSDLKSYFNHHNEKTNRIKIRYRNYVESDLYFLEIKLKNNKGRTIKTRKRVNKIETEPSTDSKNFIDENSTYDSNKVFPELWNTFSRITLVHKTRNERLTIDIELYFKLYSNNRETHIPHIVIAEVKQEKASVNSDFIQTMKKYHIRKSGMSKYCIGTVLLNKNIKSNNFKERILTINKLKNVKRIIA